MNPHTDIPDLLLFALAPFLLFPGLLSRRLAWFGVTLLAAAVLGVLLCDTAVQLPFPANFAPNPDNRTAEIPEVQAALWLTGTLVFAAALACPRNATWLLICCLVAPALSIVPFAANAVASSGNLYTHDDGVAREALGRVGEQIGALGMLTGTVFAASAWAPALWQTAARSAICLGFGIASLAWSWNLHNGVFALAMTGLPWLAHVRRLRGLGDFLVLDVRWRRIGLAAGGALALAQLLGVLAHFFGAGRAVTGWITLGPVGILPLTATYPLIPTILMALAMDGQPVGPWTRPRSPTQWALFGLLSAALAGWLMVRHAALGGLVVGAAAAAWGLSLLLPGWASLGFLVCGLTMGALLIQGETGLVALVALTALVWWMAASGRPFRALAVVAVGLAVGVPALIGLVYSSPELLAAFSGIIDRLSWLVLGWDDARLEQMTGAWSVFRAAGWWGTGLRTPGGPLDTPAWTNDFLIMTTSHFLGVCGGIGLGAGSVLPACAAARIAADQAFEKDADNARPMALLLLSWAVLFGVGSLWITAGSMGLVPLSGVSMGFGSPSLNHLLFGLPVVGLLARRASAPHIPRVVSRGGLRLALHAAAVLLATLSGLTVASGWRKLARRDDAWVLPLQSVGTARLLPDGSGVVLDGKHLAPGTHFEVGSAVVRVEEQAVSLVAIHLDEAALRRGVTFGEGGRHAPILPEEMIALLAGSFGVSSATAVGMFEPFGAHDIALTNDVWLEGGRARWREMRLQRFGNELVVIAALDGSDVVVIGATDAEGAATFAGERLRVGDGDRIRVRDTWEFTVHERGQDVELEWSAGAPASRPVPRDRALAIGDRTLAPQQRQDEVLVGQADAEFDLLGWTGGLVIHGTLQPGLGHWFPKRHEATRPQSTWRPSTPGTAGSGGLRPGSRTPPPCAWAPDSPGQTAIIRSTTAGVSTAGGGSGRRSTDPGEGLLRPDRIWVPYSSVSRAEAHRSLGPFPIGASMSTSRLLSLALSPTWLALSPTWLALLSLAVVGCADEAHYRITDVAPTSDNVDRLRTNAAGAVTGVRRPRREVLDPITQSEATAERGTLRDRYGEPLNAWIEREGWVPVEPWLDWLGRRTVRNRPVKSGHPERGTRTEMSYSGLQHDLDPLLAGLYVPEDPYSELWDRLYEIAPEGGADVFLTLSMPLMREGAKAVEAEARKMATAAMSIGAIRQVEEDRPCRAWEVNFVATAPDGALLAALTGFGGIEAGPAGDQVFFTWDANDPRASCIGEFDGPLRALTDPIHAGSIGKVLVYALSVDVAARNGPYLQLEERDDDLWVRNLGDGINADASELYIAEPADGNLTSIYGRPVPPCHDHGSPVGTLRIIDAFANSRNAGSCWLAGAVQLSGHFFEPALKALRMRGTIDLLPPFGVPLLDRARLPPRAALALGGTLDVLDGDEVSVREASKLALSQDIMPTTLGMVASTQMLAAGGVYHAPYLLLGVREANGRVTRHTPDPGIRIVSELSVEWLDKAFHATVLTPGATAYTGLRRVSAARRADMGAKTGTATPFPNGKFVPSPKAVVVRYPMSSPDQVSMGVWCRHASAAGAGTHVLDDNAALNVVADIVESGVLDASPGPQPGAVPAGSVASVTP